eukprot:Nitzschia sp. Nitz4//scaffold40_size135432//45669//48297//NITZ4_003237-RA/size135432-snap-gene-0.125-mRNA-1//-1//CDS//3329551198//4286//frame0
METAKSPFPPLWKEGEVQEREDGYLLLAEVPSDIQLELHWEDSKEQPFLLNSSEEFLKLIFPKANSKAEALGMTSEPLVEAQPSANVTGSQDEADGAECNDDDEADADNLEDEEPAASTEDADVDEGAPTEGDEKPSDKQKTGSEQKKAEPIPPEFLVYQSLERSDRVGNLLQSLMLDVQKSRHRKRMGKRDERGAKSDRKVGQLQKQQEQLLNTEQKDEKADTNDATMVDESGNVIANDGDKDAGVAANDDEDDENSTFDKEPYLVRLVRFYNSVRAVFPHIIAMLNHKRRTTRHNGLQSALGKKLKNPGKSCWMFGTQVYDIVSRKIANTTEREICAVLKSILTTTLAMEVANDPIGSPGDFWVSSWAAAIQARAAPELLDPLVVLKGFLSDGEEIDFDHALLCEDNFFTAGSLPTPAVQKQYDTSVRTLHKRVSRILEDRFKDSRVTIYGSCLSNLSLGKGADVDLSLVTPKASQLNNDFQEGVIDARTYTSQMKTLVYQVFHKFNNKKGEFVEMEAVPYARVPVVRGAFKYAMNPYTQDGSLHFDICFLNDIAVANSRLLREYSLVDERVRKLMMAVKAWAKAHHIASAQENGLSSYTWINLVIFYLQCIGFVPNLQSEELMKLVGFTPDPKRNYWHSVNKLETHFLEWDQVKKAKIWAMPEEFKATPVSVLLYGFFEFYSYRYPAASYVISIKQATAFPHKLLYRPSKLLCIEDPFETFVSHCPHDLGTPANEGGMITIMDRFAAAELHLREVLLKKTQSVKLWADPVFEPKEPAAKGRNRRRKGGSKQKGGQTNVGDNKPKNETKTDSKDTGKSQRRGGGRGGEGRGGGRGGRGRGGRGRQHNQSNK